MKTKIDKVIASGLKTLAKQASAKALRTRAAPRRAIKSSVVKRARVCFAQRIAAPRPLARQNRARLHRRGESPLLNARGRTMAEEEEEDDDVFTIMVATDSHLGYCDRDAVRGTDSFAAF